MIKEIANIAHNRREEILKLKKVGSFTWLKLGEKLYEVERDNDWEILGFESMRSYLSAPENSGGLDLTRSWLMDFKCNYEKFIQELGRPGDQIAQLEPSKLRYIRPIVDKDNVEEWLEKVKQLSRSDLILEIKESQKTETPELPEGKYQVIYMDLPWKYDVDLSEGATRSPENNYPVMDLEEIKEFGKKVKELAANDCVLFMWITAPKLNWMNDVLAACGFEYKTNLIWDKIKPNLGHYSSVRHEILVIAGKGKCAPTCDGKTIQSIDSVQSIEKSVKHSEKPQEFYEIIEKLYPDKKCIELFARGKPRKGWWAWGNEANDE